jgi:hypothetical protein
MRKLLTICFSLFLFSCGSGDTGEGYSDTTGGLNTNVGPTDTITSATTGDRVNPDSNAQADPYDERHRQDANNSPNTTPQQPPTNAPANTQGNPGQQ